MKTECIFRADEIAKLAAAHPGQNVKISIDHSRNIYKASIVPPAGSAAMMAATADGGETIDGCPYPPGCN